MKLKQRRITSLCVSICVAIAPAYAAANRVAVSPSARYLPGRSLLIVGDSLTDYSQGVRLPNGDNLQDALARIKSSDGYPRWTSVHVIAERGKSTPWGQAQMTEYLARNPNVFEIVAALGTNDVIYASTQHDLRIRMFLDAAKGRRVTWLTVELSASAPKKLRDNAAVFNRALRTIDADPTYASQLRVVDWAAHFPDRCAQPAAYDPDTIHLNDSGYRCRILFIRDQLQM